MDVIELLGVPVRALCMGQVGGPAVGVLSVCHHRASMPSTRFSLREPTTQFETQGPRRGAVGAAAGRRAPALHRARGARPRTPAESVAEAFGRGAFMSAQEALDFGLIDEISRPKGAIHQMPGAADRVPARSLTLCLRSDPWLDLAQTYDAV